MLGEKREGSILGVEDAEVVAVCKLLVIVLLIVERNSIDEGDTMVDTEND